MRISDWSSDVCSSDLDEHAGPARWLSHFHRSPDGLARFEPITLKNRDFRQQQFECHGRANCAAMFDEFQPALGNFAGTHQAMTLHFQSEPCNRDAFVTPGWAQCRHRLLINAGIADRKSTRLNSTLLFRS